MPIHWLPWCEAIHCPRTKAPENSSALAEGLVQTPLCLAAYHQPQEGKSTPTTASTTCRLVLLLTLKRTAAPGGELVLLPRETGTCLSETIRGEKCTIFKGGKEG